MKDKIQLSTQNVFDQRHKSFISSRRAAQLANKFKDKTFDQRTKKIAIVAFSLAAGCTAFSAFSAHFYLLNIFKSLGSPLIAMGLTILILSAIEYGKRDTLPEFFKNWFQYKSLDGVNLGISLGLMAMSITFSFLGSHLIPGQLAPAPDVVSIDSIQGHYSSLITAKANEAQIYFDQNNWKGKLDNTSRPTYNKLIEQKNGLEAKKNEAIEQAKADNKGTLINHENNLKSQGVQLGFITLGSEFLLVLLIGFLEYRDFRAVSQFANIQNHESDNVEVTNVTSKQNENRSNENRTDDKQPTHRTSDLKDNTKVVKTKIVNVNGLDNCEHCNKQYKKNHHKQKYCSTQCRKDAWEQKTGKKLYLKN